jgi:hypothetical protein
LENINSEVKNIQRFWHASPRLSGSAFTAILLAGLLTCVPTTSKADSGKALSDQDVIELLNGGVPSSRVSSIIDDRGINFDLTGTIEQRVRNAGGDDGLIDSLRRAAQRRAEIERPQTGGLVLKTTPGEAEVYLNDEPKGMSSPEGAIRLTDLQPGDYKVRVSSIGFKSYEQTISVSAGEDQTVYVTLVQKGSQVAHPGFTPDQPLTLSGMPIPGIKIAPLQFFEGPHEKTLDKSDRVYRTSFDAQSTRSIFWEIDLSYPAPGRHVNFTLDAFWYRPDGSELRHQTLDGYAETDWKSSWHTLGYGWVDAGHWPKGTYKVEILFKGLHLVTGSFEIY